MNIIPILVGLTSIVALAGCNQSAGPKQPAASGVAGNNMAGKAVPAKMKHGTGSGTVTAIDAKAGTITLDHGKVVELGWPAMEMGFGAKSDTLDGIAVDDEVEFEFDWNGTTGEITSIKKRAN